MLIATTLSLASIVTPFVHAVEPGLPVPAEVGAGEAPAESPAEVANPVHEWLDKIEAKGVETKTVTGKVKYTANQTIQGDVQIRLGEIHYTAGPPAKFAVEFNTRLVKKGNGFARKEETRAYVFDGAWLVEKIVDRKQFFKWQVVPPNQVGKADPLALGRGPFVVPLSLKKEQMLERFYVSIAEPDAKDPKDSIHLTLIPKKGQRINFTKLDIWYDRDTITLLKAKTIDESKTESTFELLEPKFNEAIDTAKIDVAEPKESGWEVQITPWEE